MWNFWKTKQTRNLRKKMLLFIDFFFIIILFFYIFKKQNLKARRFTLYINTSLHWTKKMVAFAHCASVAKSVQQLWVSRGVTTPVNILLHKSHLTSVAICWHVETRSVETEERVPLKWGERSSHTCYTVNNNSSFLNEGVAHCPEKEKSNP